jgi:hypothetical protein
VHIQPQTTGENDIAIGSTLYQSFGPGGMPGNWTKTPGRHDRSALGLASAGGIGLVLSSLTRGDHGQHP